jgi:translation initiation factor 3 subunit I
MVSGAADNTLRLWNVATGKCLYTWEFPTAVKRVSFSDDDSQVVCITEQRMGYQCAIRVFTINREGDGTKRELSLSLFCLLQFGFRILFPLRFI